MTSADDTSTPGTAPGDHAACCAASSSPIPEVVGIEMLGQTEMPGGTISYSLGVMLPGGRELFVDVEDA